MGHDDVCVEELDGYTPDAVSLHHPSFIWDFVHLGFTDLFCSAEITIWEGQRLWAFWLGLPVPPRAWKIKTPGSDSQSREPVNRHSEL